MEWDHYDISLTVLLFGFCFCSRVFIWATITKFFHYSLRLLPSPNPNPTVLDKLTLLYPIGRRAFESQSKKSKTERLKGVPPMAPCRNGLIKAHFKFKDWNEWEPKEPVQRSEASMMLTHEKQTQTHLIWWRQNLFGRISQRQCFLTSPSRWQTLVLWATLKPSNQTIIPESVSK